MARSPRCFSSKSQCPGREAAIDFTHGTDLEVTIAGEPLPHLLFEFVLSYSGWRWVAVAFGETFEALVAGLQDALWALGGVPAVLRSDNLSAATHELKHSSGRDLTTRFRAVLEHYGLRSSRITPGRAHENGIAEQAHRRLKAVVAQALVLRGHADFATVAAYEAFVRAAVVALAQLTRPDRAIADRAALRALPSSRDSELHDLSARRPTLEHDSRGAPDLFRPGAPDGPHRGSARACRSRRGPVPRAAGADDAALARGGRASRRLPPCDWLVGPQARRVCALSLSRGPVPSVTFRRAFDALQTTHGERADVEYLRILQLAALHGEARVTDALARGARRRPLRLCRRAAARRPAHPDDSGPPPAGARPARL